MNEKSKKSPFATKKDIIDLKNDIKNNIKDSIKKSENNLRKEFDNKLEKLAQITAKGFSGVNARIDKLENRMDKLENRMDKLEGRFDKLEEIMEKGIDKMREIADGMAGQFITWKEENAVGAIVQNRHEEQLNNHETRINILEKTVK